MQLFNTKTIAALFIAGAMSVGTASAGDLDSNAGKGGKKAGNADSLTDVISSDAFIDVKGAIASRFRGFTSSPKGSSARLRAQQDFLNRSSRFASNDL